MYRIYCPNFYGQEDNPRYFLNWDSPGWTTNSEEAMVMPYKIAEDIRQSIPTWEGEVWLLEEVK